MPTSPVRQKATLAQPTAPLPKKPELKKIFRQFHQEISNLKPVRYIYLPAIPANRLSLPNTVGKILTAAGLINQDGQPLYKNRSKLDDPLFKRHLETKLFLSIADHAIHTAYFKTFAPVFLQEVFNNLHLREQWIASTQLLCEELAKEASINFCVEYYAPYFLGQQPPNFLSVEPANKQTKKIIKQFINKNASIYKAFFPHFLLPVKTVTSQQKNKIINQSLKTINQKIAQIDPIPQPFLVTVESQPYPSLNLHYPD